MRQGTEQDTKPTEDHNMKTRKNLVCFILAFVMLFGMIPVYAAEPDASELDISEYEIAEVPAEPAEEEPEMQVRALAADTTFTQVGIADTTGEKLKEYLEMDGNFIIQISCDIHAWLGEKGDDSYWPPNVPYWCTLGSGTKVVNLNGNDVKLSYDKSNAQEDDWSDMDGEYKSFYCTPMTMLRVPSGAELVINDDGNTGEISYDAYMNIERVGVGDTFLENRNLIEVDGGKLTVNGGKLFAGRSKKFYSYFEAENYYAQINGTAVILKSGDVVINGGDFHGRGYVRINRYGADVRDAAIKATGGNLTIYDGEFYGMGSADVMQIGDSVNIAVYGGSFNTHKVERIAFEILGTYDPVYGSYSSTSYGNVGLPARAFQNVGTRTNVYKTGTGDLTAEQVAAGETLDTWRDIEVSPVEVQSGVMYRYNGSSFTELADGATVEWDKVTNLKFRFTHDQYYPHTWRDIDHIYGQDYGNTYALISEKPLGVMQVAKTSLTTSDTVDLNDLSQSVKDTLEVGKTYYLTIRDTEKWMTPSCTREILYQADTKKIKLRIVEPDLTMPDLDFSVTWENSLDSSGKNRIRLIPTGDAFWSNIDTLMNNGKISECRLTYYYQDHNDARQTYVQDTNTNSNTGGGVPFTDFYRGISTVTLKMEVWKGDSFLGSKTASADVLCFPDITADRTIDSNRILVDPSSGSDHSVTLSCDANGITGLFWTKDGLDVGGYGRDTFSVDVTGSGKVGWYSLAYTVGDKDYFSDQQIYLGIKNASRSVSISTSSSTYTLTADGQTAPTLTATISSSGWGDITNYKWHPVSWPEGVKPKAWSVGTGKTNTIQITNIFGYAGHETSAFVEGTYKFSVTAIDSYGNEATSGTVSVYVSRPAQGLQLWHEAVEDSWHVNETGKDIVSENVTDSFIILYNEDATENLSAVFTPEKATAVSVAYNAMSDAVSVNSSGWIQGKSAGSATITATTGTGLSASTKVLVPKTKYDVTIPESWLKVEAGATVHRGTVPTTYADYSVELSWEAKGSSDWYEYSETTFAGNSLYRPVVKIYPQPGVCYPVNIYYESSYTMYYPEDNDRYVITVNGVDYYGVDYCGKQRDYFMDREPLSEGGRYDYIEMHLTPTEKIIDWRDEYINRAVFILDVPSDGDQRDMTPEDELTLLNCTVLTDGVIVSNTVKHVTDLSTIKDSNISNDKLEDFETYKEGETYRASIMLVIDSSYKTSLGGKAYFADQATAIEPELGALTGERYSSYIMGYVYFTVGEESDAISTHGTAKIRQASASFEGKIILNFYLLLDDDVLADRGAYVILNGGTQRKKILVSDATVKTADGETRYCFTYPVVAKELRDNVNLHIYDGSGLPIKLTNVAGTNDYTHAGVDYSLWTYCNKMIESSTSSEDMKALAQATIDYGTAAQIYFDYNATGLTVSDRVTSVTLSDLEQYKGVFSGTLPTGVSKRTLTALFEEDNSLRIYFTYESGYSPSAYTYTIDGKKATLNGKHGTSGDEYYLEVKGVPSNKLGKTHDLTISNGSTTYKITVSVLTYARSSVSNGTTARQNLGKALYRYYLAAKAKFGE